MYGAGNIGRGFIGKRFYLSGYHTVFVDVNADMVEKLRAAGKYPIYVTKGTEYVPEWVRKLHRSKRQRQRRRYRRWHPAISWRPLSA